MPVPGPPVTESDLRRDLAALGVRGDTPLVVHSSLRAIGWVVGGAPVLVQALVDALGDAGTLAMPAATPQSGDPANWVPPAFPREWLEDIREHLPVFDPRTTPTTLGLVPETFRNWPQTVRSRHPLESVCALGPLADEIVRDHALAFSEGPGTPFDKLHELDSRILLIGVGFNRCTALHFAETLASRRRTTTVRFPAVDDGRRIWIEVANVADDNDVHFPVIGQKYLGTGRARRGRIGNAGSTLIEMQDLVRFAVEYFESVL